MQAVGSEPSTHPDLISSTMLSKGVSFQKPGLEGWAMAPPIKKTRHTTLIDAILTPGVVWRTAGEIVIVSTRTQWLLYSYFKFSTYSVVPVRIVLVCTPRVRTYDLLSVGDGSVRESYLIRILPQASDPERLMLHRDCLICWRFRIVTSATGAFSVVCDTIPWIVEGVIHLFCLFRTMGELLRESERNRVWISSLIDMEEETRRTRRLHTVLLLNGYHWTCHSRDNIVHDHWCVHFFCFRIW